MKLNIIITCLLFFLLSAIAFSQLPVIKPEHISKLSDLDQRAKEFADKNLNRFAIERLSWYDATLDSFYVLEMQDTLAAIEQTYLAESAGNNRTVKSCKKEIAALTAEKNEYQTTYYQLVRKAVLAFFVWLTIVIIVMQIRRKRVKRAELQLDKGNVQKTRMLDLNSKASLLFTTLKTISHSVNEIRSELENLSSQASADEKGKIDSIVASVSKEARLINNLLDQETSNVNEKVKTNINELCDSYVDAAYRGMLSEQTEFNCIVTRDFEKNLPEIKVDPAAVGSLLLNILSNSFTAVYQKQKENIKSYQPKVAVSTRILPRFLQIRIRDNGDGISDEQFEKIYKEFYSTLAPEKGVGLGLFESKRIISELHNGEIKIESEKGNHTDVYIKFFI